LAVAPLAADCERMTAWSIPPSRKCNLDREKSWSHILDLWEIQAHILQMEPLP